MVPQDAEMMEQIDRDVMRTHPGLHFFSGDDGAAVTHREVSRALLFSSAPHPAGLSQQPPTLATSLPASVETISC